MAEKSGLVRKCDKLGRLYIPIELRELCGFSSNDDLELCVENGVLQIRKYVARDSALSDFLNRLLKVMEEDTGADFVIINGYDIIAGKPLDRINGEVLSALQKRDEANSLEEWANGYLIYSLGGQMRFVIVGKNLQPFLNKIRSYKQILHELIRWLQGHDFDFERLFGRITWKYGVKHCEKS